MLLLKQSTAVTVKVGPFVDDSDGKTAETGLTISQGDIRLSKNGGAFAQTNNATGATHDENGYYGVPLDTTDTGTLGTLVVAVSESGALPVFREFMIVPANIYDSLVSGSDYLQIDVEQVDGGGTAAANLKSACDNYSVTRGLSGTALPAAAADAAGGLVISDAGGLDIDALDSNVSDILTDTAEIGAAGAGLTAVPWNASWDAEVQSECTDALNAYDPPTKNEMDIAFLAVPSVGAIADAVWDEVYAEHSDMGSFAQKFNDDLDTIVTDTAELQGDLTDGGRLDLLIDAIKAKTDNLPADPADDSDIDSQLATIDANVDAIVAKLPSKDYITGTANADGDVEMDDATGNYPGSVGSISGITFPTNFDDLSITDTTGRVDVASIEGADATNQINAACDSALDTAISGPTSASLSWYIQKMFIALVNKAIVTEASGNTEQFNDSNVSIGTINAALTSDGTYTTRLRLVQ